MIEAQELTGYISSVATLKGEYNKSVEYLNPPTQTKEVTPTQETIVVLPDKDYYALTKVIVKPYYPYSLCSNCYLLEEIDLTSLLTFTSSMGSSAFLNCISLTTIKIAKDFNIDKFDCHNAFNLSHECLLEMLNNLIDLTGATAKTLTLGATNLAKLTDEEKLIATNKNWILA